jgi:hypothetical protein
MPASKGLHNPVAYPVISEKELLLLLGLGRGNGKEHYKGGRLFNEDNIPVFTKASAGR